MKEENNFPEVALIIAAYNEEDIILDKVQNCFGLDYPKGKLKIKFVTDGSIDETSYILRAIKGIELHHLDDRKGKLAAVNRIVEACQSPIIILTDANCFLNKDAIKNIVRHYRDPRVGGVAGEKRIRKDFSSTTAGSGEGIYWRYESWLKQLDSDLNSVVGAAGELFSFRKSVYEAVPPDTIIEDFVLSMRIAMRGFRVVYEPDAYALEAPSVSVREEWKRKVRICAGAFQAFRYLPGIWNPFKYGVLSFQYLSHRFLRWTVVPFLLPLIIIFSGILSTQSTFYTGLFLIELIVLAITLIGLIVMDRISLPKIVTILTYILMMNAAAYAGLYRYWRGSQSVVWEKAKRHLL